MKAILGNLDKNIITDQLLPMLESIRSQPLDQEINLILLDLFKSVSQSVDLEVTVVMHR